ncbi:uncharacterized protein J3D65DRAFT_475516 [Phyllosticta citribraziliensis]|uniref:Uncharacterized protein n=1 Tax=Phyllosticta citribraziliensis TaxID=989973 RepID=A0ABR1LG08_9PEZI
MFVKTLIVQAIYQFRLALYGISFRLVGVLSYCLIASLSFDHLHVLHYCFYMFLTRARTPLRVNSVLFVSSFTLDSLHARHGSPALADLLVSRGTVRRGGWENEVPLVPGPLTLHSDLAVPARSPSTALFPKKSASPSKTRSIQGVEDGSVGDAGQQRLLL